MRHAQLPVKRTNPWTCSRFALLVGGLVAWGAPAALAQGTSFTYQGRLMDNGTAANGSYDFRFTLYDASVGGLQVGPLVTRDDVVVTGGLFTSSLDFGGSAFIGSARWLEVAVRPGASMGAYTVMGSRQELTPTPNTIFSSSTPWSGVWAKPPGFVDDVDDDVLGGLSCASGQMATWNGTAWACAVDANSGGRVTSVGTGAGLAGGPITLTGTVSVAAQGIASGMIANGAVMSAKIANGAVGGAQIANGAVGLSQVNTAEVQARVGASCPEGQYLRGINPNGTVLCEPFLPPPVITTVDYSGIDPFSCHTGWWSSIAIGNDGLPVISYAEDCQSHGFVGLKVTKCGNAACSAGNTTAYVDTSPNSVGAYSALTIGTDGLPVISYYDATAGALMVAHCGSNDCSAGNTNTTVDDQPANVVGEYTSLAIGSDGLPVISYYARTIGALKVAKCGNGACAAGNTITIVDDPADDAGQYSSLAIGTDGLPVISYHSYHGATAEVLKVAHCGNAACSAGNTITVVDGRPWDAVGSYTSIAIGADGLPVMSYHDDHAIFGELKVAKCGTRSCQ